MVRFGSLFGSVLCSVLFGSVRFGSARYGSVRLGSVRFGFDCFGFDCFGFVLSCFDRFCSADRQAKEGKKKRVRLCFRVCLILVSRLKVRSSTSKYVLWPCGYASG